MASFTGYSIGLALPYAVQLAVARLRASIDVNLKANTPFDPNQAPHITVIRDIAKENTEEGCQHILKQLPLKIAMTELHRFILPEYDVLAKMVSTAQIKTMNTALCAKFGLSFPYDFSPHITLAFLKSDATLVLTNVEKNIRIPNTFTVDNLLVFNPQGIVSTIVSANDSTVF